MPQSRKWQLTINNPVEKGITHLHFQKPGSKEGPMYFLVYDADNNLCFERGNWPMARSALDSLISEDKGCPRLKIRPEK